jgi:hypothetical protein
LAAEELGTITTSGSPPAIRQVHGDDRLRGRVVELEVAVTYRTGDIPLMNINIVDSERCAWDRAGPQPPDG